MLDKDEFVSEDIEYYRSDKVPATGHFINETDKNANNL
jgi:DNA gyrase subunit A